MSLDDALSRAVELLAPAKRIAVLTGAGVSKESGIPTFRDAQTGLWAKYDPQQLATRDAFRRDPDLVWSWYRFRYGLVSAASPNGGHTALAELETLVEQVVILTQNVDGLHARAGSTDVVELHGNITRSKCFDACQGEPTLVDLGTIPYDDEHAPVCPHCEEGLLRPDVVWYGENLSESVLKRARRMCKDCHVMLVVGTSGLVQPAASLPALVRTLGKPIIEINPDKTPITMLSDVFLQGASGTILPRLVDALKVRGAATRDI